MRHGRTYLTICGLTLASLAIRLACSLKLELFLDEAVYAWMGLYAPLDFAPQPPGTGLLARLGIALLDRDEIGVRLASLVVGTCIIPLVYIIGSSISGERVGLWSAVAVACVPMYLPMGFVMSTDGPQLAIWCAALCLAWRALKTNEARWWLLLGLLLGLGLFVKYVIALFFVSLGLCLLLGPQWRRHLLTPGPWLSVLVAALVFVPVFLWREQATGWSSIRFHLADRHAPAQFHALDLLYYFGVHLLYVSPLLYLMSIAAIGWTGWRGIRFADSRMLFLFCFSAPVFLLFLVACAFTERITGREHWDAPAYIAALIGAVMYLEQRMTRSHAAIRWRVTAVTSCGLGLLIIVALVAETFTGSVTRAFGRPTPLTAWFLGWRELASEVQQTAHKHNADFVLFDTWFTMFPTGWYLNEHSPHYTLTDSREVGWGMRRPLERWGFSQNRMASQLGKNAIFVYSDPLTKPGRTERMERITKMFESTVELSPIPIYAYGRNIKEYRLFLCRKLNSL